MSESFNLALVIIQLVKEIISLPMNFIATKECIIYFMITFIWLYFLCWLIYKIFAFVKNIFKQYRSKNMLKSL